jgi:hypothetical protein
MSTASVTARFSRHLLVPRAFRALGLAALLALAIPAAAGAERLTDKDVKTLMERIHQERDRFEDQLDGKLKRSIVRGPGGEVNVARHLDDLQENVNKMKDRYTGRYAASQEVTTVLQQGAGIQRFMASQAPNLDGASEWNRLSASLGELAAVYGTSFPLPEGQSARRLSDDEVKAAATAVAADADKFKKELDNSLKKDKSIDPNARKAAVQEADDLKKDAKALADVVGGGRPASGEARALVGRAAKLKSASATWPLSPAAQTSWRSVESGLAKITQAFALPPG